MKSIHSILVLICSALLSACGFHLRGSEFDAFSLPAFHFRSADPHSEFSRLIATRIAAKQIAEGSIAPTLVIAHEDLTQSLAVMGANTQNRQYTLIFIAHYALLDAHEKTCEQNEIRIVRSSSVNPNQMLSSSNEQSSIIMQMHADAATQLMMRLASPEVRERCLTRIKNPHP